MLTDTACRKAEARTADYKLADSGGLFLFVRKSGSKVWRWKYRWRGKEKQLTIGTYPAISLKEARAERDKARLALSGGVDPSAEKQRLAQNGKAAASDSFETIALRWHELQQVRWSARYAGHMKSRMEQNLFPFIGQLSIKEITPPIMLEVIRKIEAREAYDMAHRVKGIASDVFVWAIAAGLAEQDPAAIITKALRPKTKQLRPALLKLPLLHQFISDTEKRPGTYWATRLAALLLALTAARPGVVRMAERDEFEGLEGSSPLWRIPAAKMKLTRERKQDAAYEFVIPLSFQAVAVVKEAQEHSLHPTLLFPGIGNSRKPISDSTLSKHFRDSGYTDQHVPHGWRASFSTIMNERAADMERDSDREIIDMMLAHIKGDVEAAYNRAAYMRRRREIAQEWADLILPRK